MPTPAPTTNNVISQLLATLPTAAGKLPPDIDTVLPDADTLAPEQLVLTAEGDATVTPVGKLSVSAKFVNDNANEFKTRIFS